MTGSDSRSGETPTDSGGLRYQPASRDLVVGDVDAHRGIASVWTGSAIPSTSDGVVLRIVGSRKETPRAFSHGATDAWYPASFWPTGHAQAFRRPSAGAQEDRITGYLSLAFFSRFEVFDEHRCARFRWQILQARDVDQYAACDDAVPQVVDAELRIAFAVLMSAVDGRCKSARCRECGTTRRYDCARSRDKRDGVGRESTVHRVLGLGLSGPAVSGECAKPMTVPVLASASAVSASIRDQVRTPS